MIRHRHPNYLITVSMALKTRSDQIEYRTPVRFQLRSSCVFSEFVPFHALIVHGSLAYVPWRSAESDPFALTSAEHMGLRHATVRLKRGESDFRDGRWVENCDLTSGKEKDVRLTVKKSKV